MPMSPDSDRGPIRIGVVGLGYWGPNLARNLARVKGCELAWCCDLDAGNRERFAAQFPTARFTGQVEDLLADPTLDGIVIATASSTHHRLGLQALEAGKHVMIEKPLAQSSQDARALVVAARERGRILMVGHLLRFHPGFVKVLDLVRAGDLGRVLYLYANRQNFGKVRADENALWSLAPHDLSLLLALVGERPRRVVAHGAAYLQPAIADVVFCYLEFPSGITAHLHLSWLDPHKRRMLTVVGTERMVVFDDTEADRKVTVYEKASWPARFETWGEFQALTSGDVHIPRLASDEPLQLEMQAFVEAIASGVDPLTAGEEGLAVVEVLEALQASLDAGGLPVELG